MKVYNEVISDVRPEEMEINELVVRVATDVEEMELDMEGEIKTVYQYTLTEYDKDEYIQVMSDAQEAANEAIDYLLMGGE